MNPDIDSFAIIDDAADIGVVDRTTLDRYATCPAMARFIESGTVTDNSAIAQAGEEVHKALGETVTEYIYSGGGANPPGESADTLRGMLFGARPDVQPEAVKAARGSAWPFAQFLSKISPRNILRYDGGEGERSGQLSWDLESLNLRVTSELDLLYSGPSPDVLHEVDYKTGWKSHGVADIADSFQFQVHAWLVLLNYPDTKALTVQVWNTRTSGLSHPVYFERRDLPQWQARIVHAAGLLVQHRGLPPEQVPAWPTPEKCPHCPAVVHCPRREKPSGDVAANPVEWVRNLAVAEEAVAAMRKALGSHVDATGQDIVTPEGFCFGKDKPRDRKPTKSLYTAKPSTNGDDE